MPIDVDLLFGEPTVALRGPWNPSDLVKIAPSADDLVGRYEHHLDFPGKPAPPRVADWATTSSTSSTERTP